MEALVVKQIEKVTFEKNESFATLDLNIHRALETQNILCISIF